MQALMNPNKVEETFSSLEISTSKKFFVPDEDLFGHFSNATTVSTKGSLSLENKLEIRHVKNFFNLERNWDSYNALPVKSESVEKAIGFIKLVNDFGINVYLTSPGPNGEVLVQLENELREIEFIFYPEESKFVQFEKNDFVAQGNFKNENLVKMLEWLYEERR